MPGQRPRSQAVPDAGASPGRVLPQPHLRGRPEASPPRARGATQPQQPPLPAGPRALPGRRLPPPGRPQVPGDITEDHFMLFSCAIIIKNNERIQSRIRAYICLVTHFIYDPHISSLTLSKVCLLASLVSKTASKISFKC